MGGQARLDSIAALKGFRASLIGFAQAAASAIDDLDVELQRGLIWLQQDRYTYWKAKVQRSAQAYTQAKIALNQRIVFERAVQGTPSSCIDQRQALRLAEEQLREAQAGLERVRGWLQLMDRHLSQYRGKVSGLKNLIDSGIPKAIATIDRMVDSLEAYVELVPPQAPVSKQITEKPSVRRPKPDQGGGS
ncbi:MAG: hypothetical protein QHH07_09895 [Sedimentisphaerales bacterium]|jgi:hypothetical protein|nr:hypothetical protein [Sedimentisphaerales bacterium]